LTGFFVAAKSSFIVGPSFLNLLFASFFFFCRVETTGESRTVKFDVLFGPAYKGIPLGAVVSAALYSQFGVNVGYAYNRKEAKDHGEGGTLVGASMKDQRVLVVDDVITAGTAIRESYGMLQDIGATMVGVVIALDRAEKRSLDDPVSAVQAVQRDLGVSVVSIVNLPQLQTFLEKSPNVFGADTLQSVKEYRAEYGV
jgi:orotate phosphoribosyltransferase